ncbi:hypothetical protein GCM10011591_39850 [Nocardia camponoti]|uniref:Uncharacterized protein n=1 Tax=Nocardia camponoti TaxID=1616106 RepID=A0A917QQA7_9NOCA|nr:hypothetical protein GCM10011591_39850 [Nocardia camponoti]
MYGALSLHSDPNIVAVSSLSERVNCGDHVEIRYRANVGEWGQLVRTSMSLVCIGAQAACEYLGCESTDLLSDWLVRYPD